MSTVSVSSKKLDHFELDILQNAHIKGILNMDVFKEDLNDVVHLNFKPPIGVKSLSDMLELSLITKRDLHQVFKAIQKLMSTLTSHLLTPTRLSFSARNIFYSATNNDFWFCYVPSTDLSEHNELLVLARHLCFEADLIDAPIGQKLVPILKEKNFDLNLLLEVLNHQNQNPNPKSSKHTWFSKNRFKKTPFSSEKGTSSTFEGQTVKLSGNTCLIDKTDARNVYILHFDHNIVGRTDSCNVRLDDAQVSKKHALITLTLDGCAVEDLASSNGTKVNGLLIQNIHLLKNGDTLAFGDKEFVFIH